MCPLHICENFALNLPRWGIARLPARVGLLETAKGFCRLPPPPSSGWEFLSPSHDLHHFLDSEFSHFCQLDFFKTQYLVSFAFPSPPVRLSSSSYIDWLLRFWVCDLIFYRPHPFFQWAVYVFLFSPSCFIGVHTYKHHIVSVCGSSFDCFWCLLYYRKCKMWSCSWISL